MRAAGRAVTSKGRGGRAVIIERTERAWDRQKSEADFEVKITEDYIIYLSSGQAGGPNVKGTPNEKLGLAMCWSIMGGVCVFYRCNSSSGLTPPLTSLVGI